MVTGAIIAVSRVFGVGSIWCAGKGGGWPVVGGRWGGVGVRCEVEFKLVQATSKDLLRTRSHLPPSIDIE